MTNLAESEFSKASQIGALDRLNGYWTRRVLLQAGVIAVLAPFKAFSAPQNSISSLPFTLPHDGLIKRPGGLVFAHWHFFLLSLDNKPASEDYYTRNYLQPEGENGKFKKGGGYIRERPLPRPPRSDTSWKIEDFIEDLQTAAAIGIDAFQFNISGMDASTSSWNNFTDALAAVPHSGTGIKVMPCLDLSSSLRYFAPEKVAATLISIAHNAGLMRRNDGRIYVSAFLAENWPADRWKIVLDGMEAAGASPYFFPIFLNINHATPEQIALADLVSVWSSDRFGTTRGLAHHADQAHTNGQAWCHPVWPQDFRPKNNWYTEARNSELFRRDWTDAIASHSDAVNIITWNDYSEASEIRPSTGIQYGFYDLAAYYIAMFKWRTPPLITRDALYYFHRNQLVETSGTDASQPQIFALEGGGIPLNEIELVGFLIAPARLSIRTSDGETSADRPAGFVSLRAPLRPGRPRFRLERNGRIILDFFSAFTVNPSPTVVDLLYRSGSSNRSPMAAM